MAPRIKVWSAPSSDPMWSLERDLQKFRDDGWIVRAMSSRYDKMGFHFLKVDVILERDEDRG